MNDYLSDYIIDLLHINEGSSNKLIDLEANNYKNAYKLIDNNNEFLYKTIFKIASNRIGKPANVCLKNSSINSADEQRIGNDLNVFEWSTVDNNIDILGLNTFIDKTYKDIETKGANPMFLSVGALRWKLTVSLDKTKDVITPFIILPIRLVRLSINSPIYIEFINDDIYVNPCLVAKLSQVINEEFVNNFPKINDDFDNPIDIKELVNSDDYFDKVYDYIASSSDNASFSFDRNYVGISSYNHNEICMYYDVKKNKEEMLKDELIQKLFLDNQNKQNNIRNVAPDFVLPYDTVQNNIISKAISGDNMVIKGPPGSGKTLTIANIIATALSNNKRILVSSKKLAALTEVYNKLPNNIKKFVLLLDNDSEASIAKQTSKQTKKELKQELEFVKDYHYDDNIMTNKISLMQKKKDIIDKLLKYQDDIYNKKEVLGLSFYDAMDKYIGIESNEYLLGVHPEIVDSLDLANYNKLNEYINKLTDLYESITHNRKYSINNSPFIDFGSDTKSDEIIKLYKELNNYINGLIETLDIKDIDVRLLKSLIDSALDEQEISYITNNLDKFDFDKISDCLDRLLKDPKKYYLLNDDNIVANYLDVIAIDIDPNITIDDMRYVVNNKHLFDKSNTNLYKEATIINLIEIFNKIDEYKNKISEHMFNMHNVYKKDLSEKEKDNIYKSYDCFKYYIDNKVETPRLLDIKAKLLYKKISTYSYLNDVSFKDIIEGAYEYYQTFTLNDNINSTKQLIYKIFQESFDDGKLDVIKNIINKCGLNLMDYMNKINDEYEKFNLYGSKVFDKNVNYTYKDLLEAYKTISDKYDLNKCFDNKLVDNIIVKAGAAIAINKILFNNKNANINDIISKLKDNVSINLYISNIIEIFDKLNNEYNVNKNVVLTIENLLEFKDMDNEYSNISNVLNYQSLVYKFNKIMDFDGFMNNYNANPLYKLNDVFNKSLISKYLNSFVNKHLDNKERYNLTDSLNKLFNEYKENEEKIIEQNKLVVEAKIVNSINPNDIEYSFLDYERDNSNIRRLFKDNMDGILKLKKCVILSPSSLSLLFKNYTDKFDIALIDEASQLEPVSILPIAYRTKSLVLVGDEWQMPPIEHFKAKYEASTLDYEKLLNPVESALALALKNKGFSSTCLECHYRSKTESLIKFSQERFYEFLKTFPSQEPFRDDLGFNDIKVDGANCKSGINEKEANKIIEVLHEHFDKYLVDNQLTKSIGVVCFGVKQVDKVESLIKQDKDLFNKIELALRNKKEDVNDEKIFFVKTIEEVQGQEIDHLVLSLTYGVDANGKTSQRFGELNRDKLGECIFNVAVTRAKEKVTVIHSINYYDIDNPRISYIKDYLKITNEFSNNGLNQFVSSSSKINFFNQIKEYINSLGIDDDKIIVNYGNTLGSIRISIAILSNDYTHALGGLFLDYPLNNTYDYIDYNVNYYNILTSSNNWILERIYLYDWCFDNTNTKLKIKNFIESIKED